MRHFIIKLLRNKDKERILKAAREKHLITYKRGSITVTVNFSSETKEQWDLMFKGLKDRRSTNNSISSRSVLQK